MKEIVHGLWIQGNLSPLELLTIQSFLNNGYTFYLWTYTSDSMVAPSGTIIKDAEAILPFKEVFSYKMVNIHGHGKGSFAGFSDIFRYKLLYELGGIWTDMDVTLLHPFEIKEDYLFRFHHKAGAVGNFMKCPPKSKLMKWCFEEALLKINPYNTNWMLPVLILNDGIEKYQLSEAIRKISNNDSFPEVASLLTSTNPIPSEWKIIHWMNEEFRRLNICKEKCLPNSHLHRLYLENNIPHQTYMGIQILKNRIKLSRYYYLLQNIKSTLSWYLIPH